MIEEIIIWVTCNPWTVAISCGIMAGNLLIVLGVVIGIPMGVRVQKLRNPEHADYWKKQAISLEKYRNAAGMMEFYRAMAEREHADNIRLKNKFAMICETAGKEA